KLCTDQFFRGANVKVIRLTLMQMMALTQQPDDVLRRLRHGFARSSGAEDIVQPESAGDSLLYHGVRHYHKIVLVLTACGHAFWSQGTDYSAGHTAQADGFAYWVLVRKKIVYHRLSEHADRSGAVNVLLRKEATLPHLPSPDLKKLR